MTISAAEETEIGIACKVIAIIGASSGIDRATAQLLAEQGAFIVLGARHEDALRTVYAAIKNAVHTATEILRQEAGLHLRVTEISPGMVATNFNGGITDQPTKDMISD